MRSFVEVRHLTGEVIQGSGACPAIILFEVRIADLNQHVRATANLQFEDRVAGFDV